MGYVTRRCGSNAEKPCFHNRVRGTCPKGQASALSQGPVDNSSATALTSIANKIQIMNGAGCDKRKITNEPITESNTNMKTADQIELTPGVASGEVSTRERRRVALSRREQATDKNAIRPFHVNFSGSGTYRIAQAH